MKSIFAAMAAATLVSGAAHAGTVVVTFDDLVGQAPVPNGYGGINWDGNYTYYSFDQPPFTAESPSVRVYGTCDCSTDNSFFFPSPVVFDGAYFAGSATDDFELLLGGVVVATSASLSLTSTPTYLASGYSGLVDQVDIQTNDPGQWVADNITYTTTVPEPAVWTLMVVGLGLAGAGLRRRESAAAA